MKHSKFRMSSISLFSIWLHILFSVNVSCCLYYLNISLISTVSSRYLNLYILPEPALNIRYIYFKFVPAIQLYNQNFPTFFNEILQIEKVPLIQNLEGVKNTLRNLYENFCQFIKFRGYFTVAIQGGQKHNIII